MMITSIDFGCTQIRTAFRTPEKPQRINLFVERAEYAMLSDTDQYRRVLEEQGISYAVCQDALAVVGNQADSVRWLSRIPCTPLMPDGVVPADDPPARQMLHLIVSAMLPAPTDNQNLCVMTTPGNADDAMQARRNQDFLVRLVQMQGYETIVANPAEAAILATGCSASFTGAGVVMGAETTEICVARFGVPAASITIPFGSNWIDMELAKQFRIHAWSEDGGCYLDLDSIRNWKMNSELDISDTLGEKERACARLFTVVLDRITRSLAELLTLREVTTALGKQRINIMLAGGAVKTNGFVNLFTERLIEHDLADRILSVRISSDAEIAVVRGNLIFGELEMRNRRVRLAA